MPNKARSVLVLACLGPALWLACSSSDDAGLSPGSSAGSAGTTSGAAGSSHGGVSPSAGVPGTAGVGASGGNPGMGGGSSGGTPATGGASTGGSGGTGSAGMGNAGTGGAGKAGGGGMGAAGMGAAGAAPQTFDVTFYVVSDTHADPPPSSDLQPMARAVNAVAKTGAWPSKLDGQDTHFKGGAIGKPRGVVFTGDLTGWGTAPTEQITFKKYFQAGNSSESISFPGYLGFGNHDLDSADRPEPLASQYRTLQWSFLDGRHKGLNAPVPVTNFDAASHAYSWDFDKVHLIQLNRFAGDTQYGLPSAVGFLAADLKKYASDGRPVILFQHYGMDPFGTEARWWTDADRATYRAALKGYHVSAQIVGHSHAAFNYSWEGLRVFQVNNAKAEINTGNNDGNGSFAIVRVTNTQLDVVTCRWTNDNGGYELIGPWLSGPVDTGAAQ